VRYKVAVLLAAFSVAAHRGAWAQSSAAEPEPTPAGKAMSTKSDLKTALDECKSHPAVVAAGTPFEICVEGYGFVKEGERWVQKPPTR
jgi:hypothetical protein